MQLKGYFVSDLHAFSSRSQTARWQSSLSETVQRAHTLVLGGDIFDLKWSRYKTLSETIEEAMKWLRKLTALNPLCQIYYLLGNHDAHPRFVESLDRLCFEVPQLQWHPYWIRIENAVFLHGDVVDGGLDHSDIDRRRETHRASEYPPVAYRHWLYDAAIQIQLHRVIAKVARRHRWVLKKLSCYLREQGCGYEHGIEHVYFGHTHRFMEDIEFDRLHYHNGGAPIGGLAFRILETVLLQRSIEQQSIRMYPTSST